VVALSIPIAQQRKNSLADDILLTTLEGELRGYLERLKRLDESSVI
jgi:hypothetical protein